MNKLGLIKEYIDASLEWQRYRPEYLKGQVIPSVCLSEHGQEAQRRYVAAEQALSEAIEAEDWEFR